MTGVTYALTLHQQAELETFLAGPRPSKSRPNANLIRRGLLVHVSDPPGYAITSFGREVLAQHLPTIDADGVWPRDLAHRYRLYARVGERLEVLAAAPDPGGLGQAIVTLHQDAKAAGRRLCDLGRIGVLDVMPDGEPSPAGEWIVPLWDRAA